MARYLAQPYNAGLSAISDLSTTSFGRFLLTFQSGEEVAQYIGAVTSLVGKASVIRVYNDTNASLPKGSAVRLTGMFGDQATVALAQAIAGISTRTVIGLITGDIPAASAGLATTFGLVQDLNTSALVEGALVYLSADVAGGLTSVESDAPDYNLSVGLCVKSHATAGAIFVAVSSVGDLGSLSNVTTIAPADGQVLKYDAATQVWKNAAGSVNLATDATGVLPVGLGGSNATTAQVAMNTFAGAVTSAQFLRGDGTNVVMSAIQVADVPTLNQDTIGTANYATTAGSATTAVTVTGGTQIAIVSAANLATVGTLTTGVWNATTIAVLNGGTGVTTSTGTTNVVLSNSPTLVTPFANALSAVPVGSGAGNSLTIAAGSGIGTGSGANLVLNPGEFATSGTRGTVLIDGLNAGKSKS